jgi:hypothetical protein
VTITLPPSTVLPRWFKISSTNIYRSVPDSLFINFQTPLLSSDGYSIRNVLLLSSTVSFIVHTVAVEHWSWKAVPVQTPLIHLMGMPTKKNGADQKTFSANEKMLDWIWTLSRNVGGERESSSRVQKIPGVVYDILMVCIAWFRDLSAHKITLSWWIFTCCACHSLKREKRKAQNR